MKTKLITLLTIVLFLHSDLFGQVTGNQRGLYVNQFVELFHNLNPGGPNNSINTAYSILGNTTAENRLLTYCMENHITYIALYDMANIFDGSSQQANKIIALKNFICKAKSNYCIKYVGASVKLDTYLPIKNGFALRQTPPFIFDTTFHGTELYDSLRYLEDTIPSDDARFAVAEMLKLSLRIAFLNNSSISSVAWTQCPQENVDILLTEYEFWNAGNAFDDGIFNNGMDYKDLVYGIDVIRDAHNGISGNSKLFVETYMGRMAGSGGFTACDVTDYVDGREGDASPPALRRVDRVAADYYSNNPIGVYNSTANFYDRRFLNFCESSAATPACVGTLAHPPTTDNTDYHPLFSAQSPNVGASVNSNFLGSWFPGGSNRNIFTVEREFYNNFDADVTSNNVHHATKGNDVQPGACQWLGQAYMVKPLNHPITFLSSQSPCPTAGNQNVTLTYQGPIENADAYYAGTNYTYVVRNYLNVPFTPSSGNPSGIVTYTPNTTGVNSVTYSLPPGNYEASLTLTYSTGCYYTYKENIIVSDEFNIHALNHPGNLFGPLSLCGNDHVILQSNWLSTASGVSYTWTLNGASINGATSYEYSATQPGDYVCTITTPLCTLASNVFHINLVDNPPRFIVVSCGGANCPAPPAGRKEISLTILPNSTTNASLSGDVYSWSNGAGNVSNITGICTSGNPVYTATITNGGCTQTIWQDIENSMFTGSNPIAATITPASSTVCPGNLVTLTTTASTSASFLWSTGQSSTAADPLPSIDVSSPGSYFIITGNSSGCNNVTATPAIVTNYTPELGLTAPVTSICNSGEPVVLTATGGTITTSYTWSTGVIGTGSTYSTQTVNPTNTSTYSVTGIDSHGCSNTASVTVNVPTMDGCYSLSQSVVPPKTYAGHPVTFSFEVCNNTGVAQTVNLKDDDLVNLSQFVYLSGTLPLAALTSSGVNITLPASPQCTTYTATGYFLKIHDCSDGTISHATHTNNVILTPPTPASVLTSSECATILKDCPMRIVGTSTSCNVGDDVSIALNIHNTQMNVDLINVIIIYPSFLTPPTQTQLNTSLSSYVTFPYAVNPTVSIGTPSPSSYPTINGVSFNQVSLQISFASPYISSNIYNWFYRIKFKIAAGRPNGQNQFLVAVDGNLSTLSLSSSTSTFTLWTQASDIFLFNCGGVTNFFDARIAKTDPTCSKPGEFTFTSLYSGSATAIHIWDLGDSRRTPIRGQNSVTWDYLADYTDNFGTTQSRANGNYTFKVKHTIIDGGNFSVDSITVTVTGKLDATVSTTDNTCNNASAGTASVTASYGTPPYTYSWTTGATTQSVSGLHAGSYSVTVTDDNRCEKTVSFSITQPTTATLPSCASASVSNTSCITGTVLSWTSSTGCVKGYNLYVGTDNGGTSSPSNLYYANNVGNINSIILPALTPNTTYYYQVVPYDFNNSEKSGCAISSFTSGGSVTYTPTLSSPYVETFESSSVPTVPCGITTIDDNFPNDGYYWQTATGNSCGSSGSKHMIISKNTNNTTAKNDWIFSAPLYLKKRKLYRVQYDVKVDAGQTELLEVYISSSPDVATMNTTASIASNYITSNSCTTITSGDYIENTSGVYYVGIRAASAANKGNIYLDNLKVIVIQTTNLTDTINGSTPISCGATLNSCDPIYYEAYSGATSFKFKFENIEESIQKEYTFNYAANYPIYNFLLSQANSANRLDMNKTYDVSVAASTGGAYSPYGYACPVTINPIPTTGLISSNCGSTITNLNNPVTTNLTNICGVNDYKYEFKESGGSPIETTRNSSVATFLTVWIASPGVKYSTTYDVRVKLKIGNEWGEYGSTCSLSTGSSPLTELQSTYCSNYNLPSFSSSVACVAVPGAIDYKYHITGPNGYDKTFYKGNGLTTWIFSWTNAQTPHMAASTQYNVEVASNVGGVWSNYGNTCTINTPSSLRLAAQSSLTELNESIVEETVSELAMNVYPNPNSREGQLSIEISGINKIHLKLKISIYNLVGGNIYKSLIETNEENRFIIQPEIILPSGVYMVEAEVDGKVLRTKLVVE